MLREMPMVGMDLLGCFFGIDVWEVSGIEKVQIVIIGDSISTNRRVKT